MYYLVLTCVVLTFVFIKRLIASPFGRMVTAVAQNQERAISYIVKALPNCFRLAAQYAGSSGSHIEDVQ